MKKILYASNKTHVPLSEGGGEVIAFDLFSEIEKSQKAMVKALGSFSYLQLQMLNAQLRDVDVDLNVSQQGAEIETLNSGKFTYPSFAHAIYQMPDSYTTTLSRDDHYHISFVEYLNQFKPDVALLQAEGSREAWHILRNQQAIKTLLYVQNGLELNGFGPTGLEPPACLANSKFVQQKIKTQHGVDSELLYPAIALDRYRTDKMEKKEREQFTVLFINPNGVKGVHIFMYLAQKFPQVKFLVLEGWNHFDEGFIKAIEPLKNVHGLRKTWKMAELYNEIDLLLVPSQWEEAFGRVVVEAHVAGVPTLASNVGGLPEASGEAGFLVDDFKNKDAWEVELGKIVANPSLIEEKRPLFEANAQRFSADKAAERFMEIIEK